VNIEPNSELATLLREYRRAVQYFLDLCLNDGVLSLKGLNTHRREVLAKCRISGYTSVLAMRDALAIYRAWRRRRGKKRPPILRNAYMKLALPYNAKLEGDRLRITVERGVYIWLKLRIGKWQSELLSSFELGEILVKEDYVVFTVKRKYQPFLAEGVLALDVNERSINGVMVKEGKVKFYEWRLDEVYRILCNTFERVRDFQRRHPNNHALWRKVFKKWFRNRNRRVDWRLHNITKQIVGLARRNKVAIILENLKGLKIGVNRRVLKRNKVNSKVQPHRTKPRRILGRLNRFMFRRIQFMIDYKGKWGDVPIYYVDPRGTSRVCPRCGYMGGRPEWHTFRCPQCGLEMNAHYVAGLNMIRKLEDEGLLVRAGSAPHESMTLRGGRQVTRKLPEPGEVTLISLVPLYN